MLQISATENTNHQPERRVRIIVHTKQQIKNAVWYLDIILSFETNLQMMFTDIFFENDIDPEAILNSVKKLDAAVEFIEL